MVISLSICYKNWDINQKMFYILWWKYISSVLGKKCKVLMRINVPIIKLKTVKYVNSINYFEALFRIVILKK